jgi:uncharacterized protein
MSGAVSTGVPLQPTVLWSGFRTWLRRAYEVVSASAPELNRLNVFPISDSDTGTNLELTLAGIRAALADEGGTAEQVVQASVLAAHGNSGAIVAEMLVQVSGELSRTAPADVTPAGQLAARCLRVAARAATRAVARPVAGTILTVADDAAEAATTAAAVHSGDALAVVGAARRAAATSLAGTPRQLAVLAEAGVVDAGGQAYVLLLQVLEEVLGGAEAQALQVSATAAARPTATRAQELLMSGEYEVMYALRGASPDGLAALRETLSVHGGSVVVVGDETVAQVHVHLADAGQAVEAGLAHGTLSQVRITALLATPVVATRAIIAVVAGPGLADAVADLGGVPILPADGPPEGRLRVEELEQVLQEHCGDVVLLPNDMESLEVASHLAAAHRGPGRRIAVIPTTAQVQGLTALAVHEPTADFDSAVVAMSTAAGHARHAAVTIAETAAMTMAGRCEVGDVLGLLDGDFVEIGSSVLDVAERVIQRLRAGGGELLTLITGADADPDLLPRLQQRPGLADLEIDVVAGRQRRYPLLIGIE